MKEIPFKDLLCSLTKEELLEFFKKTKLSIDQRESNEISVVNDEGKKILKFKLTKGKTEVCGETEGQNIANCLLCSLILSKAIKLGKEVYQIDFENQKILVPETNEEKALRYIRRY